ncbi:hypothetical protein MYX77_00975 [Acidobacteriia bacterium AH_259_A11_L15]|nr:hypothetical protein [Acidobacteriia bacterium AH_259_A11_L15]
MAIAVDHQLYEELWHYFDFFEQPLFLEVGMPKPPWDERKPTGDLVRKLFDLRRFLPEGKPLPEPEDEAQSYVIGKLKDSRSTIDQLEEEVLARAQLQDETLREIDYQISQAALSLDHFTGWGVGYNTGVDIKRNHLERELSNLRKERRSSLLRTWQDISSLRKEFREGVVEYKSLLSRLGLL